MPLEITAAEFEDIDRALIPLARLEAPFHYRLVERNYRDLQGRNQFVSITLSLGRQFATSDRRQLGESLATAMVNWLTAMRLFLDHEEADLKRRFGKESSQVEAFKKATSAAFDDVIPAIALCTGSRSYVQHVGLPLSYSPVSGREMRARQSIRLAYRTPPPGLEATLFQSQSPGRGCLGVVAPGQPTLGRGSDVDRAAA